jgi:hypothetical protein
MRLLRIVMAVTFALGAVGTGHTQQITRTALVGTNGGGPFESACPLGSVLTGLRARAGSWVDALAPICSRWVAGTQTLGEISPLPYAGGSTGSEVFQRCKGPRGVVVGFGTWRGDNHDASVSHLYLSCGDYERPYINTALLEGSVAFLGYSQTGDGESRDCRKYGDNQVAGGIYGRSGAYVDAFGLACVSSSAFVPRPRPGDCKEGFVRRGARLNDLVCVTPRSRDLVAAENASASSRIQPGGGAYGSKTCLPGLVWRSAFDGDAVCVTPARRDEVNQENESQLGRIVN